MTQQDYTALVFIVDRSGSMWNIKEDMEGAIKALIEEQAKLPGKLTVDVTVFDTQVENVHVLANPDDVSVEINPRHSTALYDAVGKKVTSFGHLLSVMPEDDRPSQVIVAIVTDGYENASREFTAAAVKKIVEHQTETYNWNFLYLGANQDAVLTADTIGIARGGALTYDTKNTGVALAAASNYVAMTRSGISYEFTDEERKQAE